MKYSFDEVTDRRHTGSCKWDVGPDELPLWIADMDFKAAPEIIQALRNRVEHGIFGYSDVTEDWYQAYITWWKTRHNFELSPDWLIFTTGVVPAISTAVRKLTSPAEKVVIQTPVYNIFFNSILNNGRNVLESPLKYQNGAYTVDFDDLERKLSDPQTSLMILCNPHNPVGKIWDRDTLECIGELAYKHSVVVLSDEIHCDITDPGRNYIPFASVSEHCRMNSVTCMAPTKCFNLAGLQTAAVSVPNPVLRHKMWRALNTDEVAEGNVFAVPAAIAAFGQGAPWLDELREYLFENKRCFASFLAQNLPFLHLVRSEATYLLWLDCRALHSDARTIAGFLRAKTGLYVSEGSQYGACGNQFLRINIACPKKTLLDAMNRLNTGIHAFIETNSIRISE